MKYQDLTVNEFLEKTAGNNPVPGGGCISALNGAIASALTEMLAYLTIGKKKYQEVEENMKKTALEMTVNRIRFMNDINRDADAYNLVIEAFKLPKNTDEQIAKRGEKIQEATKLAALVPMEVAERAFSLMDDISETVYYGNRNAITDGCIAMMTCRNAILGALLNVRINLVSINDDAFVNEMIDKCKSLEKIAVIKEQEVIRWVNNNI
ncbi:MAG: cyclodeaminase/cyclohydrolase family protein [Dysgonamonadaceae bacterium]|jgi:formiminotetrahydrofolate cyclodeaminase|nr:cyclodeaminase/cyclohydrolase family protein [Dysgonamonadaceae bacterium]